MKREKKRRREGGSHWLVRGYNLIIGWKRIAFNERKREGGINNEGWINLMRNKSRLNDKKRLKFHYSEKEKERKSRKVRGRERGSGRDRESDGGEQQRERESEKERERENKRKWENNEAEVEKFAFSDILKQFQFHW